MVGLPPAKRQIFDLVPDGLLELVLRLVEVSREVVVDRALVVAVRVVLVPVVDADGVALLLDRLAQAQVEVGVGLVVCQAEPGCDGALFLQDVEVFLREGLGRAVVEGEVGDLAAAVAQEGQAALRVAPLDELLVVLLLHLGVLRLGVCDLRLQGAQIVLRLRSTATDDHDDDLLDDDEGEAGDQGNRQDAHESVIAGIHRPHYPTKGAEYEIPPAWAASSSSKRAGPCAAPTMRAGLSGNAPYGIRAPSPPALACQWRRWCRLARRPRGRGR